MAVRIARATCTSPESWMMMQTRLDLWEAQQKPLDVGSVDYLVDMITTLP